MIKCRGGKGEYEYVSEGGCIDFIIKRVLLHHAATANTRRRDASVRVLE